MERYQSRKKGKYNKQLSGTAPATSRSVKMEAVKDTLMQGGLVILSAIASSAVGAALGRHSLVAGVPIIFYGIHKKNMYLTAAGLGMALTNGFQKKGPPTQAINGFDMTQIAEQAKDRVGNFFENFKEKLYLSSNQGTATAGLGDGNSEDQVTYFVNPYSSSKELDTSAIDRIQEQIAEMNKPAGNSVNGDLNEMEREF